MKLDYKKLKSHFIDSGMTYEQLAEFCEYTTTGMYYIMNGKTKKPGFITILNICSALNIDPIELEINND